MLGRFRGRVSRMTLRAPREHTEIRKRLNHDLQDGHPLCLLLGGGRVCLYDRDRRVPVRLLVGRKEPRWSNFCPFRQNECILDVDAKIAHRVLDLGVAE